MTKTAVPGQMLRLLFWESTIKCNLACAHCRRIDSEDAAYRDLSTDQAGNLIEQLAELGKEQSVMPVLVFSGGEPLCRQDLFELIGKARSLTIITALATNGTLIDSKIAGRIRDSGVSRVSVSLDGATAGIHNKLRRLDGSFERAIEGTGHLRDKNVPFQINMTLTKHNAHQLEDVYSLAKSLGAVAVHIFILVPVGCGQSLADTDMLSAEQYEQKMLDISKLDSRGELQMKVLPGSRVYHRIKKQDKEATVEYHEDVLPVWEFCLWGIRGMFFHAAICLSSAAMCSRTSSRISGETILTLPGCVTAISSKASAVFAATGRYAGVAAAERMPLPAIIWQKNLFVHTCRPA
jgi:MoaA/NifB/PqqE/SkfB family radical SAM enzyme